MSANCVDLVIVGIIGRKILLLLRRLCHLVDWRSGAVQALPFLVKEIIRHLGGFYG